jgi:hypothetical protein
MRWVSKSDFLPLHDGKGEARGHLFWLCDETWAAIERRLSAVVLAATTF